MQIFIQMHSVCWLTMTMKMRMKMRMRMRMRMREMSIGEARNVVFALPAAGLTFYFTNLYDDAFLNPRRNSLIPILFLPATCNSFIARTSLWHITLRYVLLSVSILTTSLGLFCSVTEAFMLLHSASNIFTSNDLLPSVIVEYAQGYGDKPLMSLSISSAGL